MHKLENKTILVTGVCGTVGSEIIRTLVENDTYNPASIIGIDNNESELFFIANHIVNKIFHFKSFFLQLKIR